MTDLTGKVAIVTGGSTLIGAKVVEFQPEGVVPARQILLADQEGLDSWGDSSTCP